MIEWFTHLVQQTLESEVATGMTAGALLLGAITFVGYQLRSLPRRTLSLMERQFTVTLTIYGEDDVFYAFSLWLANHPATQKSRRLNIVTRWEDGESLHGAQRRIHKLTPGPGVHVLRFQNRWFLVRKEVSQPGNNNGDTVRSGRGSGGSGRKTETLTITTHGRDPAIIQRLVDAVSDVQTSKDTVPVYFWAGNGYARCTERMKRSMSTVYLDEALKQRVVDDLHSFLDRRRWYADRGIPWRRGYLFEGPPGTGKSTLIFALASLLDKPVYIINPSTIWDDGALMQAMNEAGGGMVVIEDADTFKVTQERALVRPQPHHGGREMAVPAAVWDRSRRGDEEGAGITLSGLLNAIDGIASAEGRILFITSNHPDALDSALMRPGRIDVRERLGLADAAVARQMHAAFFPEADGDAFIAGIEHRLPMAPAAIQNELLAGGHIRPAQLALVEAA